MKWEMIEEVKRAFDARRDEPLREVARTALPMPARDLLDEELRASLAAGSPPPIAARVLLAGRNFFVIRRELDGAGACRLHLYDAAGHRLATGGRDAARGDFWEED